MCAPRPARRCALNHHARSSSHGHNWTGLTASSRGSRNSQNSRGRLMTNGYFCSGAIRSHSSADKLWTSSKNLVSSRSITKCRTRPARRPRFGETVQTIQHSCWFGHYLTNRIWLNLTIQRIQITTWSCNKLCNSDTRTMSWSRCLHTRGKLSYVTFQARGLVCSRREL
jgi:hypothetical protein